MTTFATPTPEVQRDRYGRPLIIPPGGGKPVAYTRCTTYIDVLEDHFNLQQWMQRMVAIGLANRSDLLLAVQSTDPSEKGKLNKICTEAREAAGSSTAATKGTAIHSLTEMIDRGQELPSGLDAVTLAMLDAYREATADFKHLHIEQMTVLDKYKVAGTPDRVVRFNGGTYIADLKTGSIEWGALKIAQQLSIYSRSWLYDVATGERTRHDADLQRGIIVHLPVVDDPAKAHCDLHWVDLHAGWNAVTVSTMVREKRALKFADLTEPITTTPVEPSLAEQIVALTDVEAIRELWAAHADEWTDELTQTAQAHIASLGQTATAATN